ncbi:MAG: glyoxalase [Actinobacteria bacterium]|nr:glyoxalase [Actinomycetota bacterium]
MSAGFTVDQDGTCRLGSVRVRLVGRERGKRIVAWALRNLPAGVAAAGTIDGLPTRASDAERCTPSRHANGARSIDHIVLLTPNPPRTVAALGVAGFAVRRTRQTNTYGAPFLQTFFRAGEVIVELIGPDEPSGDDDAGFFGLAYTVDDLDRTKRLLGDGLGEIKDAVQPDRRIVTLRHKHFGMSVATAFMSTGPNALQASRGGRPPRR